MTPSGRAPDLRPEVARAAAASPKGAAGAGRINLGAP